MRRVMVAAALALGAAACGGSEPVQSPKLEGEVRARFEAWVKAFNWARPESLADFYVHQSYLTVAWPNGERTVGWEKEADFQKYFLPTVETMNLQPRDPVIILVRQDLAVISFPFTLNMLVGGFQQAGPGHGLMLWQREDGRWRIYAAQISHPRAVEGAVRAAGGRR